MCRKIFVTVGLGVWCWMAYRYRDLNEINRLELMHIRQQNADIMTLLQTCMLAMLCLNLLHAFIVIFNECFLIVVFTVSYS